MAKHQLYYCVLTVNKDLPVQSKLILKKPQLRDLFI
jgi:hypothetical protein